MFFIACSFFKDLTRRKPQGKNLHTQWSHSKMGMGQCWKVYERKGPGSCGELFISPVSFIIISVEVFSHMSMFPKLVGSNCLFFLQLQVPGRSLLVSHNSTKGFCFYGPFPDLCPVILIFLFLMS